MDRFGPITCPATKTAASGGQGHKYRPPRDPLTCRQRLCQLGSHILTTMFLRVRRPPQSKNITRRERLKSALYLRLKKRKTFFFGKTLIFWKFSFDKCRIVPKNVKVGTLWDLLAYIQLQNIKKIEGGTFWGH